MYFLQAYYKYTLSLLKVYFHCTSEVYFKYSLGRKHSPFLGFIYLRGALY